MSGALALLARHPEGDREREAIGRRETAAAGPRALGEHLDVVGRGDRELGRRAGQDVGVREAERELDGVEVEDAVVRGDLPARRLAPRPHEGL